MTSSDNQKQPRASSRKVGNSHDKPETLVVGPLTFWQQWTKIYTYFPSNPFSRKVGRLMYTWEDHGEKQRWIEVTDLKGADDD